MTIYPCWLAYAIRLIKTVPKTTALDDAGRNAAWVLPTYTDVEGTTQRCYGTLASSGM